MPPMVAVQCMQATNSIDAQQVMCSADTGHCETKRNLFAAFECEEVRNTRQDPDAADEVHETVVTGRKVCHLCTTTQFTV